jgi:hypothetical protein
VPVIAWILCIAHPSKRCALPINTHHTYVQAVHAICAYRGRALVGVGRYLRIYDLGKKKLLRKCENKVRFVMGFSACVNLA